MRIFIDNKKVTTKMQATEDDDEEEDDDDEIGTLSLLYICAVYK